MKVGLITTGFPRFEGDHSGAFLLTLAKGLVANGHRVVVLAPEPQEKRPRPSWPGVEVRWVPYARPRRLQQSFYGSGAPENLRRRPWRALGAASFLAVSRSAARRALADCDALVSSWCVPSGWLASGVSRGRPHLCICHATDLRWLESMFARRMVGRQIAAGASSMWFLSTAHRDQFFEAAGLNAESMPAHFGPMPTEVATELTSSRGETRAALGLVKPTLLFMGRLVPIKGADVLLHAAAALERDVQVRIAGDGPERAALALLSHRLGIDVVFEGWVSGARKETLLRASNVLVVPSRPGDGLPTVLFEARARGLPIVTTRVGAIADYIQDGPRARVVAPGDPHVLSRAIDQLTA